MTPESRQLSRYSLCWLQSVLLTVAATLTFALPLSAREPALPPEEAPQPTPLPTPTDLPPDHFPIDLPTALRLAGASNLQIALATERVRQAESHLENARVLWLPSLDAGIGYNRHEGTIQDTSGNIIEVRRSSLFAGGGPKLGTDTLNGGNNGPSRLSLGVSLTEILFAPLAERQRVHAANGAQAAAFNDALLDVAVTYLDLLRARGQIAIAVEAIKNAEELVRLVESRVKNGTAPPADGLRARTELADRQRQMFQAEEAARVSAADLIRLLRLDPTLTLVPLDCGPVPLCLVEPEMPLPDLIAQGLAGRPEMAEHQALIRATLARLKQEKWRPWLPQLQVGVSTGGFGGGPNTFFGNFNDRVDFDALAVWELRNLGFGNRAWQHDRASQHHQAELQAEQMRDRVAAEVARAYYRIRLRQEQIEAAGRQVAAALEALPLNFKGILGGQLRAIEAQQAIQALAAAQNQYLAAVVEHNQAQFQLWRAVGHAPEAPR